MIEGDTAPKIGNRVKIGNRSYGKKTGVIDATQFNVTTTNTLKRIKMGSCLPRKLSQHHA